MKTHEEALEIATEYGVGSTKDLERMMQRYLKARNMVMTPREPTQEMIDAGRLVLNSRIIEGDGFDGATKEILEAAIAASPSP